MPHFRHTLDIDSEDLVESLGYLGNGDLFDFIKKIEESVEDWDFTERLYDHFRMLHDQLEQERIDFPCEDKEV